MKEKSKIRTQLKKHRHSLTHQQVKSNSLKICQKIQDFNINPESAIGIYLPFGNEIDLRSLLSLHPNCFVPSVKGKHMQFQHWTPNLSIIKHPLGMQQPSFDSEYLAPPLDICFMPLLGFDYQGHRLGMGGGYYDRYFEHNTNNSLLIGVAHDCQQATELPRDDWDVKLNAIITESQHIIINSKRGNI